MNEREIIECLHARSEERIPGLFCGIGDDCAVIEKDAGRSWLVTMDTLVENVHFDLHWHSPEKLGRKAVAVNVSDIAAMGGVPLFVFLSLGLPLDFKPSWMESFAQGIHAACREYSCVLAGGDTVRSPEGVLISITLIGEVPADEVVFRRGALPGDTIWVSGKLGMAAAGLALCKNGISPHSPAMEALIEAHLNPFAQVRLGRLLAKSRVIHAMMDLSDGLATDLSHLCRESGAGAVIRADALPVPSSLHEAAVRLQLDPVDLMIRGGEDYQLVFTGKQESADQIKRLADKTGTVVTKIGTIVDGVGVRLILPATEQGEEREIDIGFGGYNHFPNR